MGPVRSRTRSTSGCPSSVRTPSSEIRVRRAAGRSPASSSASARLARRGSSAFRSTSRRTGYRFFQQLDGAPGVAELGVDDRSPEAFDQPGRVVRHPVPIDQSVSHQPAECSHQILDRHAGILQMRPVQVHSVPAQPLQTCLQRCAHGVAAQSLDSPISSRENQSTSGAALIGLSGSRRRTDDWRKRFAPRSGTGRLRPGDALPASRRLAGDLGVSRWVVTEGVPAARRRGLPHHPGRIRRPDRGRRRPPTPAPPRRRTGGR